MAESAKRRAPAAERAIRVLDKLSVAEGPLGVTELARELGAPKSSVYGICETLTEVGVLYSSAQGYSLGAHCLRWASAYLDGSSLVSEFRRLLEKERRLAQYTVTLSVLEEGQVVYLACQNSEKPLGFTFQIGMRLPAVFSATGKAMLSFSAAGDRDAAMSGPWPAPFTSNSVPDKETFLADTVRWKKLGYAVDNGEIREGMVCLGAPILGPGHKPVAGIAISMTSAEARPEVREELGQIVRDIAGMLGQYHL